MSVAVGALVHRDNKVLFVRQTYGKLKGKWSLPTGFVDRGEFPDVSAVRETLEESSIKAEINGLLGLCNVYWNDEPQLYIVYLCKYIDGKPIADGVENDKAIYFSLEEMDSFNESFEGLCELIARRYLEGDFHLLKPVDISNLDSSYTIGFL
jgi:ADP-ribose pyrophosphatase YjhB (NUDIX family)